LHEDEPSGHRVFILYRQEPGARFEWGHYLERYQPLACICVLYFADAEAMQRFRHLFASGHEETAAVLADEPNYTSIQPRFMAAAYQRMHPGLDGPAGDRAYRLRVLLLARAAGARLDSGALEAAVEPFDMTLARARAEAGG